jgi:ketosteroid isomerase-like protein
LTALELATDAGACGFTNQGDIVLSETEAVVREGYEAFNDRDIERAVALMDPGVEWPNVVEGGFVHGHAGVRRHWEEVFSSSEPRIEVEEVEPRPDGILAAHVHQIVKGPDGQTVSDDHLTHVFRVRDGLIKRMHVETSTANTHGNT